MTQEQLAALLERMTLSEKIAQLTQLTPSFFTGANESGEITDPMAWLGLNEQDLQKIGSVLGTHTKEEVIKIQKAHLKTNRLKIPLLFMADVIHGYETIFPIPLGLGATWNVDLVRKVAALSAIEASEAGIHVTFSPMVDLVRDPRWGRVLESTGEDPYLNSLFAEAFVKGYQGEEGELAFNLDKIAACVKHFAAYGAAEAGRDYNTVDLSVRELYQNYLPAFSAAIKAGVKLVMTAFNTVDGMPASGNKWLMKEVLRNHLKFTGTLISDWGAVAELIMHGVAKDAKAAASLALDAGVEIEMMTSCYLKTLASLVSEGQIGIEQIDHSVMSVLNLKNELGLFEDPYRGVRKDKAFVRTFSEKHRAVARRAVAESIVLLKNDQELLPLKKHNKIALIGPAATTQDLLGAWSWIGRKEDCITIESGLTEVFLHLQVAGCESYETVSEAEMKKIIAISHDCDVILVALGETSEVTGEGASLATIRLPAAQEILLEEVAKIGRPVVTLIVAGRPLDLKQVEKYSTAILFSWFPGTEGGSGIADIIAGAVNPSAKLPMSFPYTTGQVPVYYNHLKTGRPLNEQNKDQKYTSRYLDIPNEPLYPFGYGLSYTTFHYGKMKQDKTQLTRGASITFEVTIKNAGQYDGHEILQLYLEDVTATIARPVRELKRFKKVWIPKGQTIIVNFTLSEADLSYYHRDLTFKADAGQFNVFLGSDSKCKKCGDFYLVD